MSSEALSSASGSAEVSPGANGKAGSSQDPPVRVSSQDPPAHVSSQDPPAHVEPSARRKRKRRPPPPGSDWTIRYALVALVIVLVAAALEGLLIRWLIGRGPLGLGLSGLLLDATMLATLIPLYRRRHFGPRALGLRGAPPAAAVGWVFLSVIAISITNAFWLHSVLGLRRPSTLDITLHGSAAALVIAGLFICVSAPVIEEVFFRGLLYRALRNRLNVAWAAGIDGVLFGLVHGLAYPVDTLPPRMVFGVIACLLYERTGSLLPGIALHCLIDAGGFEAAVSGHNRVVPGIFVLLALVLLAYAGLRRGARAISARRARPEPEAPPAPRPT